MTQIFWLTNEKPSPKSVGVITHEYLSVGFGNRSIEKLNSRPSSPQLDLEKLAKSLLQNSAIMDIVDILSGSGSSPAATLSSQISKSQNNNNKPDTIAKPDLQPKLTGKQISNTKQFIERFKTNSPSTLYPI